MIPQASPPVQGCGSDTAEKIPPPDGRGSFRLLYIRSAPPALRTFSHTPPPLLNVCLVDCFFACPSFFSLLLHCAYAVVKVHGSLPEPSQRKVTLPLKKVPSLTVTEISHYWTFLPPKCFFDKTARNSICCSYLLIKDTFSFDVYFCQSFHIILMIYFQLSIEFISS